LNVFETIATMLAGIGLFFTGVKIVSSSLKKMASRKFRLLMANWTGNTFLRGFWGFMSGAISQSSSNTTFILISLVSSGVLTVSSSLPIVAWSYVGNALLIFLVAFNIKLGILFLLGITGISYGLSRSHERQNFYSALFGISLLLYGFFMLKAGAKPFAELDIIQNIIRDSAKSLIIPFVVGALLRFIAQSSSTVTILLMTLAHAGILSLEQVAFGIYGTYVGSGLTVIFFSTNIKGTPKQISYFQAFFDFFGAFLMVSLLVVEIFGDIPIVLRFVEMLSTDIDQQVAYIFLIRQLLPALMISSFTAPISVLLEKISPATEEEDYSKLKYIYDQALYDPETALDLIEKEQQRVLQRFPMMLDFIRPHENPKGKLTLKGLNDSTIQLNDEIDSFTTNLVNMNISHSSSERLLNIQNRQSLLESLRENIYSISVTITDANLSKELLPLFNNMIEALHTILLTMADVAKNKEDMDIRILLEITQDRGSMMEEIRKSHMTGEYELVAADRPVLLFVTDLFQRSIWMIRRWTYTSIAL
jgi:phosphate:Na+ symporter